MEWSIEGKQFKLDKMTCYTINIMDPYNYLVALISKYYGEKDAQQVRTCGFQLCL